MLRTNAGCDLGHLAGDVLEVFGWSDYVDVARHAKITVVPRASIVATTWGSTSLLVTSTSMSDHWANRTKWSAENFE